MEAVVKEYRNGLDVYTEKSLTGKFLSESHLDHVVELHVIRDCFQQLVRDPKLKRVGRYSGERALAIKHIEDDCLQAVKSNVNEEDNLNFTTRGINKDKYNAVAKFQKEWQSANKDWDMPGLVHFLLLEQEDIQPRTVTKRNNMSRKVTRRIQSEMKKSWDAINDKFEEEQPLQKEFKGFLRANMVAMDLKYTR